MQIALKLTEQSTKKCFLSDNPSKDCFLSDNPPKDCFLSDNPPKDCLLSDNPPKDCFLSENPPKYCFLSGKWNESGFRPPLCTYRLNWARRTSWGWWDDWDDTVLQTQDSKFESWRSEAEHATSRSRRLPTILTFTRGWGRNIFVSFKPPRPGTEPRTLAWKAVVLTTTLGPPPFFRAILQKIAFFRTILHRRTTDYICSAPQNQKGSSFLPVK